VFGEEAAALSECDGVGEHAVDIANGGAGDGDEVVANAEERFADDFYVVLEKQIEVLEHRTGEAVFDGNNGSVDGFLNQFLENVGRESAGYDHGICCETQSGFVAEGTGLSLYSDSHSMTFSAGFARAGIAIF